MQCDMCPTTSNGNCSRTCWNIHVLYFLVMAFNQKNWDLNVLVQNEPYNHTCVFEPAHILLTFSPYSQKSAKPLPGIFTIVSETSTRYWSAVQYKQLARYLLYTKCTMLFSLVSATTMATGLFDAQNLNEGPELLLDFSCLLESIASSHAQHYIATIIRYC